MIAEFLDQITVLFQELVQVVGYPGVFLVMFLENLIPPIPTDPLLPLAGMLVVEGQFTFLGVWATAVSGALLGSLVLYSIGAWADDRVLRAIVRRYGRYIDVGEAELDRAFAAFERHGAWYIYFGRMVPVIRSAVTLAAGASRMPLPKFVLFTVLNSLTITGFWIFVGVQLGENWTEVLDGINRFQPMIIGLAVLAFAYVVVRYMRRRARRRARMPLLVAEGDIDPKPQHDTAQ